MGIIVNQEDTRTELQKRVAQELADKNKKKHEVIGDTPDGVEDSAFVKDLQGSKATLGIWLALAVLVAVVLVVMFINSGK